ncbi:ABC transporter permease [Streptomyces sp. N2-109]|uniref:ABC transporter permease n=1 Tax=Streptomyces gossypii TaxID=2883101 RepID=A0ABT2JZD0_9ACTN|nr:FtsX-like permease family protein [Streptomyces gossypii]MCT2593013.1 ABC transporter permease [Streptomyces gossypii]MCT2593746.1 ABC transporter permease [Streptomyces gossypii]
MTVVKTSMRNFFAHKGRMALSAIAVLLSVAFVSGTLVFTDTMNSTFDKLFAATSADVTVSPKNAGSGEENPRSGKPETLPADTLERARQAEGAKRAEGVVLSQSVTVVNEENENLGASSGAPTLAGNWTQNDRRSMEITSGHSPRGPTEVMLDADTADKHDLKLGDEIRTIAVTGDRTAKISGIATFKVTNPGAAIVYFDTETAQKFLLGATGVYTNVAVTAESGVSHEVLKKNVTGQLGGAGAFKYETQQEAAEANADDLGSFLDVMKYAMLGFAGIAFLVGIFLIVNTFSMLVAQRTREIGLMRAIGSSRKQINRSVLFEAVMLGVIGSVLGVAAGVGLAVGLMQLMGMVGMELDTSELTVKATTPVIGLVLGIVVTVLAAYLPARRAGKVSPMAALRDSGISSDGRAGRIRAAIGLLLTAGGGLALVAASQADEASAGASMLGLGVLLTLVGFVVVGPLLAGFVVRGLSVVVLRMFGSVGRLAERNALRNPRRTGATGAALMIGLALVACLSVVGSSMVASATDELDKSVGADFIVQSDNGQPITPAAAKKMQQMTKTGELEHVSEYKIVDSQIRTESGKLTDAEDVTAASPTYAQDLRVEVVEGKLSDAYGENSMSIDEEFAKQYKVGLGDELTVAFKKGKRVDGKGVPLTVKAITSSETVVDNGAFYLSIATAERLVPADQMPLNQIMFGKAKDGQAEAAYTALKQQLDPYPQYKVRDQADFKQTLKDQIGALLNIVYGLLALAIIVAVLGVVNTLALSVVERTREIGLMRAIGLSRRQLRRMIRLESVVIALFGALLGLGLGMGWGATAQKLLALEGLKVLEIPWPTILIVFAGSAVVGLVAALVPAFRAGRMNVLNAIATD